MASVERLCGNCKDLINSSSDRSFQGTWRDSILGTKGVRLWDPIWHPDVLSFRKNVEAGCLFCQLVWSTFSDPELQLICDSAKLGDDPSSQEQDVGTNFRITGGISSPWKTERNDQRYLKNHFVANLAFRAKDGSLLTREVYILEAEHLPMVIHGLQIYPKQEIPYIPNALHTARHWLDHCVRYHKSHSDPTLTHNSEWMPTRLLSLGVNSNTEIHLCLSETLPRRFEYVTLSHRWSELGHLTLTSANLESLMSNVAFDSLTKVFQDAVLITRQLGYQYLWIDALCILQDSQKDWAKESPRMMKVYAQGVLNIAADTEAAQEGLFLQQKQQPQRQQQLRVPTLEIIVPDRCGIIASLSNAVSSKYDNSKSWKKLPPGKYICIDQRVWDRLVTQSILEKRAWILQERILAKRILHFTSSGMFFECSEFQASQYLPHGFPKDLVNEIKSNFKGSIIPSFEDHAGSFTSQQLDIVQGKWMELVSEYSNRNLTYGSDKLIAIAGLAQLFKVWLQNASYAAGIWRYTRTHDPFNSRFLFQLLWSTQRFAPCKPSSVYRAPSWSWASIDGPITWQTQSKGKGSFAAIAHVNGLELDSEGDEFGFVRNASLRMQCNLFQPERGVKQDTNGFWSELFEDLDDKNLRGRPRHERRVAIFYAPILITPYFHLDEPFYYFWGLLLESTGTLNEFRRVGKFRGKGAETFELIRFMIDEQCEKSRFAVDGFLKLPDFGKVNDAGNTREYGKHVISIV